jgi:hypothetical protein
MTMGSVLGRLEAREAAARERADLLRAEMAVLAEKLAAEEAAVGRFLSARETVPEVMAGPDRPDDVAFAVRQEELEVEEAGPAAELSEDVVVALAVTGEAKVRGGSLQVPEFSAGAAVEVLPRVYRDVLGVIGRSAGRGVRAKAVCEELGLRGEPKHIEALRGKLKRLARQGWLTEPSPGRQPQIRLVDVGQAAILQRVRRPDDGGVADVAAVRDQQRGDRHVQVAQPRLAAGDGGERLVGAGPREHLQQGLRQIHTRQHRLPQLSQGDGFAAPAPERRSASSGAGEPAPVHR